MVAVRCAGHWLHWLLGLWLACGASVAGAEDWQVWQEGSMRGSQERAVRPDIQWKLVLDGAQERLRAWEVKPRLQTTLRAGLAASATYKLSGSHGAAGDWSSAHAFEFDLIPSWAVGDDGGRAQFLQRLAVVRLFDADSAGLRYHMIPKLSWPAAWLPRQAMADGFVEAVYDFDAATLVELKITPLRMHFSAGPGRSWSVGYVFNEKRSTSAEPWQRFHVITFGLNFSLTERPRAGRLVASAPD